ncbi:hypothetical protein [Solitalea koreensis]|nr:hypothetical protein [Solitalea koreensis]
MLKQFKIASIALLTIIGLTTSSCEKVKDLVTADVNLSMSTLTFDIPKTAQGSVAVTTGSTAMDVNALIKASAGEKFGVNNIRSLKITSCVLELNTAIIRDNDFSALQNVKVELSSNTNTNFVTLAEVASNPTTTASRLEIPVNSTIDLKDYFSASNFYVRVSGATRRATTEPLHCTAVIKYTANVGL